MTIKKLGNKVSKHFPFLMVKGIALKPQRFWAYLKVFNEEQEKQARKQGFVKSNKGEQK